MSLMLIAVETDKGTFQWTPHRDSPVIALYSQYPELSDGSVLSQTLTDFFPGPFGRFLGKLEDVLGEGPNGFRRQMQNFERIAANLLPDTVATELPPALQEVALRKSA